MFIQVGKKFLNLDHVVSVEDCGNCVKVKDRHAQTAEFVGDDAAAVLAAVKPAPAPVAEKKAKG